MPTAARFCWTCWLARGFWLVPMEGVEPTHSYEYQILSLARLPIPPHRLPANQLMCLEHTNVQGSAQAASDPNRSGRGWTNHEIHQPHENIVMVISKARCFAPVRPWTAVTWNIAPRRGLRHSFGGRFTINIAPRRGWAPTGQRAIGSGGRERGKRRKRQRTAALQNASDLSRATGSERVESLVIRAL
jgi:hypothetical protein